MKANISLRTLSAIYQVTDFTWDECKRLSDFEAAYIIKNQAGATL